VNIARVLISLLKLAELWFVVGGSAFLSAINREVMVRQG
jgi:hypothetical protein